MEMESTHTNSTCFRVTVCGAIQVNVTGSNLSLPPLWVTADATPEGIHIQYRYVFFLSSNIICIQHTANAFKLYIIPNDQLCLHHDTKIKLNQSENCMQKKT